MHFLEFPYKSTAPCTRMITWFHQHRRLIEWIERSRELNSLEIKVESFNCWETNGRSDGKKHLASCGFLQHWQHVNAATDEIEGNWLKWLTSTSMTLFLIYFCDGSQEIHFINHSRVLISLCMRPDDPIFTSISLLRFVFCVCLSTFYLLI